MMQKLVALLVVFCLSWNRIDAACTTDADCTPSTQACNPAAAGGGECLECSSVSCTSPQKCGVVHDASVVSCVCSDTSKTGAACDLTCPAQCAPRACAANSGGTAAECLACNANYVGLTCDLACPTKCGASATCSVDSSVTPAVAVCDACEGNYKTGLCTECLDTHAGDGCTLECTDPVCTSPKVCGIAPGQTAQSCVCPEGKTGTNCNINCPDCSGNKVCVVDSESASTSKCECHPDYFGDDCEDEKCKKSGEDNVCQNGGTCGDDFKCACKDTHEGEWCEKEKEPENAASSVAASVSALMLSFLGVLLL